MDDFSDIFNDSLMEEELEMDTNETSFDDFHDVFNDSLMSAELLCDFDESQNYDGLISSSPLPVYLDNYDDIFLDSPIEEIAVNPDVSLYDSVISSSAVTNVVGAASVNSYNPEEYPTFAEMEDLVSERHDNNIIASNLTENLLGERRVRAHGSRNQIGGAVASAIPNLHFSLTPISENEVRYSDFNHRIMSTVYNVQHNFHEYADIFAVEHEIDSIFRDIVNERTREAADNDIVSVSINHENLLTPIYISSRKSSFDPQNFLNSIYEVCQSDRTMILSGNMEVVIEITEQLQGSAHSKLPTTVDQERQRMRCLVHIRNIDSSCGFYAIALAMYYSASNANQNMKRDLRENRRNLLIALTDEFCTESGIAIDTPLVIETFGDIDRYLNLQGIRFFVINGVTKNCLYKSAFRHAREVFIEHYENHYNVITSIEAYTSNRNFCRECWVGYTRLNEHRCSLSCEKCLQSIGCFGESVTCTECNMTFNGITCFDNHKKFKICRTKKKCASCEVEYYSRNPHSCGKFNCSKCGDVYEDSPHYCFIKRKDISKLHEEDSRNQIIVCFDIESRFESEVQEINRVTRKHVPMCLCARVVCNYCYNYEVNDKRRTASGFDFCSICRNGTLIYEGEDCVKNFGDYVYNCLAKFADQTKSKLLVIAHNFRGYDGHFIMQDLFRRNFTKVDPIMNGTKILKLSVGNVSFIDSFGFLSMPLARLPKVFNFENRALKGYFPYTFNTAENINYRGRIPEQHHFGTSRMMADELAKFERWYQSVRNSEYDLNTEARKYCKNDADILMIAVMNFKKHQTNITSINPLTRNFTLAAMCLEVFRAKVLRNDKTLSVTPIGGYTPRMTSISEAAWLDLQQKNFECKIKRQYRIGKFYADGFVRHGNQKIVFEYWGCFFHGCLHYANRDQRLANNETAEQLYDKVLKKRDYYRRLGLQIVEVWECEFKRESECGVSKEYILERLKHYKEIKEVGVLDIREAFHGGRTNNIRFHYTAQENEEIKYKDVVSLYPTVLKYKYFPVGHPEILYEDFDYSLDSYVEGFVKCKLLPPQECYIALIGQKFNKRLVFPLCRTCGNDKSLTECSHSDEERCLISTFTIVELRVAIQRLGYRIMKIYQVANYRERRNDIFVNYVTMFQKVKQESSGFPVGVVTEEEIEEYLNDFEHHENIRLERSKVESNPGMYAMTKQSLNGLWGKICQKPNLPQTVICSNYAHFWNIMNNDEIEVLGHTFANDRTVIVNFRKKNLEDCDEGNTSVATAAYVTAHARIYLFEIIEKVIRNGYDRLLYFDTDSVIYVHRNGDIDLETGSYFGDLTDEISKYGTNARATKFVSCGPKNYGLEININGERITTIKTKGIRYDASILETITLETMVEMAKRYIEGNLDERRVMQWQIRSNSNDHVVRTVEFEKIFRVVSEKRRIIGNGTVPYGFKGNLPYVC